MIKVYRYKGYWVPATADVRIKCDSCGRRAEPVRGASSTRSALARVKDEYRALGWTLARTKAKCPRCNGIVPIRKKATRRPVGIQE